MSAVVVIAALVVLWLLMIRFGHDSRDRLYSEEERLAARGFLWEDLADPGWLPFLARERQAELLGSAPRAQPPRGSPAADPRTTPAAAGRARLARQLRGLADRIEAGRAAGGLRA